MGNLLQSLLSLIVVIGCIFAVAWVLRRVQGLRPRGAAGLKIHAGLSVGGRERVLWVEAGGQHLLIGVAPGRINTLHVFAEPPVSADAATTAPAVAAPGFADLLRKSLGREAA